MIDPNPSPSRKLRLLAHIARWSLGVLLALWLLLLGVWGALHGFIVPRIGEWRTQVERLATQAIGAPVRIGTLTARSEGVFPTFELLDLQILDTQQRPALSLPRVVVTLSPRSVLRAGLEQLYIESPDLDVRHLADGRWRVAGLDVAHDGSTEGHATAEWLLNQPELVVRHGRVRFTDEKAGRPAVLLQAVDVVARHRHRHHLLRLDASPVHAPNERLQVLGAFTQPLLPSRQAPWTRWSGQWFASAQLHAIPALPWPANWGIARLQGQGASRLWLDVQRGRIAGATADLALPSVEVLWQDPAQPALQLRQLHTRLTADWHDQSWQLRAEDFRFEQVDGLQWPASRWQLRALGPYEAPHTTELHISDADLVMASALAQSVPLPRTLHERLQQWQPRGGLHNLELQWRSASDYRAQGRVSGLSLARQEVDAAIGTPGVDGLDMVFELHHNGGTAQLAMQSGTLHFPGIFEEASIPIDTLDATLRWSIANDAVEVQVVHGRFANADAEGELRAHWKTGAHAEPRLPGHLQLRGQLERANGARVYRYLPLTIPATARDYVRDSVRSGQARAVQFEVDGPLAEMPFATPGSGTFRIEAPLQHVAYDYVPAHGVVSAEGQWPGLRDLQGLLRFEGTSMRVERAQSSFAGHPLLRLRDIHAHIPDLQHPKVHVEGGGHTDLASMLALVKGSPIADWTDHALDAVRTQGDAQLALRLHLPIDDLAHSTVDGSVRFARNRLQFNAWSPPIEQLVGRVHFSHQGFRLQGVQGQTLGGPVTLEGGMPSPQLGVEVRARGTVDATSLHNADFLPGLAALAPFARGQARYAVDIQALHGQQTVTVASDLHGLGVGLPEPFNKAIDSAWPLRVVYRHHETEHVEVHLADRLHAQLQFPQSVVAAPVRPSGWLHVGRSHVVPAEDGLDVQLNWPRLDLDAWQAVWSQVHATGLHRASSEGIDWVPDRLRWNIPQLRWQQRDVQALQGDVRHGYGLWQGEVRAQQFAGTFRFLPPSVQNTQGKLSAQFAHLHIPRAEAERLGQSSAASELPESLPALDIAVRNFQVDGTDLGHLQLRAHNRHGPLGREWQLEQFSLENADAHWNAEGRWAREHLNAPRRTALAFSLSMHSAGHLLSRLGHPGLIRDGQGRIHGHVAWQGAPILPDWKSMDGQVHIDVDKGQFLKVEPGVGKLLSVLSLQSLPRRVSLDFRDVFSQGFAFDFIRGDLLLQRGVASSTNLQMKGLNAAVLLEGSASLVQETQNLSVVVVPEINAMTASLAATAINPVVGVGSFVAQILLRGPLMEAATRRFRIQGSWSDPVVQSIPATTAASNGTSTPPEHSP